MSQIDQEKLVILEKEFKAHKNGIEMPNFIWLMSCSMNYPKSEKYQLYNGLVKLFHDIDINGDKHIEWDEFTQYIVDAVITQTKDTYGSNQTEETDQEHQVSSRKVAMMAAYSKAEKNFSIRNDLSDKETFHHLIARLIWDEGSHSRPCRAFLYEENDNKIKVLSNKLTLKEELKIPLPMTTAFQQSPVHIFDMAANTAQSLVGCITNDSKVHFWKVGDKTEHVWQQTFPELQLKLWYLVETDTWATCNYNYDVLFWQFRHKHRQEITDFVQVFSVAMHMDKITGFIEVTTFVDSGS